jgi:murein L,D-transpeptidase YcbB/YkuD
MSIRTEAAGRPVVTEDGIVHFFEDVYRQDRVLERPLDRVEWERS